jgi:hypothetical protein
VLLISLFPATAPSEEEPSTLSFKSRTDAIILVCSLEDEQGDSIERIKTYWEPALTRLRTLHSPSPERLHIPLILAGSKLDLCLDAEPKGRQRAVRAANQLVADGELVPVWSSRAPRLAISARPC